MKYMSCLKKKTDEQVFFKNSCFLCLVHLADSIPINHTLALGLKIKKEAEMIKGTFTKERKNEEHGEEIANNYFERFSLDCV